MKKKIKRLFYKLILPIRKAYWFIFRPETYGVKVMIEKDGKVLMIRNSYGAKMWTFPGGGKNKNETPEQAAIRETSEEVGLCLSELNYLGSHFSERQYKRDTIYCFYKKVDSEHFKIDNDEVLEANWFDIEAVPLYQSEAVSVIIDFYKECFKK